MNRWSVIASQLPGRTDNDVKNYWNTKLKKKLLVAGANHLTAAASGGNFMSAANSPNIEMEAAYSIDSKFSNNFPYFPVDANSYQEILDSQIPLPDLIEAPGNLALIPSAPASLSPLDHNNANGASWSTSNGSCEDDDAFLVELMPYDLLNTFDFQEKFNHLEQEQPIYQSFTY